MMKKIILFLLIILPTAIFGQQKITKSETTIVILGKKYYVHTVKKGETLYSISKAYDVPQKQVMLINQEEVVNLLAGDILKIPASRDVEHSSEYDITFINHTVEKKQSLYSIAQAYNVTQEEIFEYNPKAKDGVKKGDILKIPIKKFKELKGEDEFFIYYQVKEGDTFEKLAGEYNTTVAQLKLVNPKISDQPKQGNIILIPKKEFTEADFLFLQGDTTLIPDLIDFDPLYFDDPSCEPCSEFVYKEEKIFKVAYLLPLFLDDNLSKSEYLVQSPKKGSFYWITEKFFEFYEGSLLAINDLRERGLSVDIYVYDTKKDSATIASIIQKPELKNMDLIIGPLYSDNLQQVSDFAKENRVNVISPFSQKSETLAENPFIFQVVPSKNTIVANEAEFFSKYIDSNLVVIHNGTIEEEEYIDIFKQKLANELLLETDTDRIFFKEINFVETGTSGVADALKKDTNNVVIIFSTDEIFMGKIINFLYATSIDEEKNITVYGMPEWELSSNFKLEYLKKLKIHYPTYSHIDYSDFQTKDFIGDYRETFNAEPTVYSFHGYDVSYYFFSALKRYGKFFQFCLSPADLEPNRYGMFLNFDFVRIDKYSGFENNAVFILHYDEELNLKKVEN